LKLKILIITSEFPPLPGGIGNHAMHLALSLKQEGKEVTIITDQRSKNSIEDIAFDDKLNIDVIRVKREKLILITYFNRIVKSVLYLNKNKNAVVLCSGKFSLWIGAIISLFFLNKLVAIIHGSEINAGGSYSKKITKWSLNKFKKIIAVSNFTKKLILEKNSNLNVDVINNGFSFPKFSENRNHDSIIETLNIITVGNVTHRKGQQNVIKALPLLKTKFPNVHYHIVGIPTQKEELVTLLNSLKVLENITFHGILSENDLIKIISNSKVFFMLSDNLKNGDVEGFGIAVLEANSFGLPAIGSKESGIADAIKPNFSGELVNQKNPEEVVMAVEKIMNNYELYSKNAMQWAKEFDWNIVVKKYLKVIE
jgi:phosphatidylinositol alpha-1,6-mannosyltransferase